MARFIAGGTEENQPFLLKWMAERIKGWDISYDKDVRTIYQIEVADDGTTELVAVVALNRWTNGSVDLHMATDMKHRWMDPQFIYDVYRYIFITCKMARINLVVHVDNIASLKTQEKMGHTRLCVLKHGYGHGEDAVLWGFTIEDYLNSKWAKDPSTVVSE